MHTLGFKQKSKEKYYPNDHLKTNIISGSVSIRPHLIETLEWGMISKLKSVHHLMYFIDGKYYQSINFTKLKNSDKSGI